VRGVFDFDGELVAAGAGTGAWGASDGVEWH